MNNPLVSVVVVTYNSANTVTETLDSIVNQTYKNIELVISDDCSTDNTIKLVANWIENNQNRFIRTILVSNEKNEGTVRNLNRGIKCSTGQWIKSIAGDDKLFENAIAEYILFVNTYKDCKMCISGVELFSTQNIPIKKLSKEYDNYLKQTDVSLEKQKTQIIKKMLFPGPTYFYSKELYDVVGGFDERYKLSEEWPFCYNVIKQNYKIYVIHKKLVKYRLSTSSVCRSPRYLYGNPSWVLDNRSFFLKVRKKEMLKRWMILSVFIQWIDYTKRYLYIRYGDKILIKILILIIELINPLYYITAVKKIVRLSNK